MDNKLFVVDGLENLTNNEMIKTEGGSVVVAALLFGFFMGALAGLIGNLDG